MREIIGERVKRMNISQLGSNFSPVPCSGPKLYPATQHPPIGFILVWFQFPYICYRLLSKPEHHEASLLRSVRNIFIIVFITMIIMIAIIIKRIVVMLMLMIIGSSAIPSYVWGIDQEGAYLYSGETSSKSWRMRQLNKCLQAQNVQNCENCAKFVKYA